MSEHQFLDKLSPNFIIILPPRTGKLSPSILFHSTFKVSLALNF